MDKPTLDLARLNDWPWEIPTRPQRCLAGDDIIAIAVGCLRQTRQQIVAYTAEDAAILRRRGHWMWARRHHGSNSREWHTALNYSIYLNA